MKTKNLILLSIFTFIISCSKKNLDYCKNEIELISPDKETKVLDFKLTDDVESIFNKLDSELNLVCDIENIYGLKVDGVDLKTYSVKACDITYLHRMFTVDIIFNEKGKVLIETSINYDVLEIENISDWFIKNYPLKEDRQLNKINVTWYEGITEEKLSEGIKGIIRGYLSSMEKISIHEYKKSICQLSDSEIKKIKTILPFEFELRNYSRLDILE